MVAHIGIAFTSAIFLWPMVLRADVMPPIRMCPVSSTHEYNTHEYIPVNTIPAHPPNNVFIQTEPWSWQMFPDGIIYPNYLAAVQNRLACVWNYDPNIKWNWDITLGGRAPLVRYGNQSALFPEGWQLDMEGSVHLRLNLLDQMDMEANDFRAGFPLSYGTKIWQFRTGYYHVSTHIGDERLLRYYGSQSDPLNMGDPYYRGKDTYKSNYDQRVHRLNYYREAWLLSYAYRPTPNTRVYAEVDYAFMRGELTKPWHFQFGKEYSPIYPARGGWGTPFAAVNVRLMEEHNFDGNVTVQLGWQWRGSRNQVFRIGAQYFNGVSEQYSFLIHRRERKVGIGIWHDF